MSWQRDWNLSLQDDALSRPQRFEPTSPSNGRSQSQNSSVQAVTRETTVSEMQPMIMTDERKGDSHIKFKMPSSLREMEGDYKDPLLPQCVITPSMIEQLTPEIPPSQHDLFCEDPSTGADRDPGEWGDGKADSDVLSARPANLILPPQIRFTESVHVENDHGELVADVKGPSTEDTKLIRVSDRKAIERYWRDGFKCIGNGVLAIIAEKWIIDVEPKKQSKYPYNGDPECKPPWWPKKLEHQGPQHMGKANLVEFCLCLFKTLRATGCKRGNAVGSADWFHEGYRAMQYKIKERYPKVNETAVEDLMRSIIKILKHRQRFDRSEIDGTAVVSVRGLPAKPSRERASRGSGRSSRVEASENGHQTDGTGTEQRPNRVNIGQQDQSPQPIEQCYNGNNSSLGISPVEQVEQVVSVAYPMPLQHNISNNMYCGHVLRPVRSIGSNTLVGWGYQPSEGHTMVFQVSSEELMSQTDIAARNQGNVDITYDNALNFHFLYNNARMPHGVINNGSLTQGSPFSATSLPLGRIQYANGAEVQMQTDLRPPYEFHSPESRGEHQLRRIPPSESMDYGRQH